MRLKSDFNQIKDRIMESDVVSFDIFDTLLLRNVMEPKDLFEIIENRFFNANNVKTNFKNIRISAEKEARINSNEEEITLDEIYIYVNKQLGDIASSLKKLELEVELQFLIPNVEMRKLFDIAKNSEKKVYIISDMYLSKQDIEKILKENCISGYNQLYISSEIKKTKATGTLYEYIRETESISSKHRWLHIGDNYRSDVLNAEKSGVCGYFYQKINEREESVSTISIGDSIIQAVIINHNFRLRERDYWYSFGVRVVASLFIGLLHWLSEELRDKNNIYFLARDGYLPYQLYNLLTEKQTGLPEARYLYASRRSYLFPQLVHEKPEQAIETLMLHNKGFDQQISLMEILLNVGLNPDDYHSKVNEFGIDSLSAKIEYTNENTIKSFLFSIWTDIKLVLDRELVLLKQYLEQSGINDYEEINIFDIGWSGSTHKVIQEITKKKVNGYYFGTLESMVSELIPYSKGYAFNTGSPLQDRNQIIDQVMMYEFVFSAPEGSLINFKLDDQGQIGFNLKNVEENSDMYDKIKSMQLGINDVFVTALNYFEDIKSISKTYAVGSTKEFINKFQANDMIEFSLLSNSVGLGQTIDVKKYTTHISLHEYISNRKKLNSDAEKNLWKNSIVIEDSQGRLFNRREIEKLYGIKTIANIDRFIKYARLLRKAMLNPKKALKKLLVLLRVIIKKKK
ncbi:HAD-IA family hydrolase [Paenibacillus sp. HB172176]|uniref:HAD family hydrolase n=1 Tax=Paenibacillus sp. HB172176 TaxID=2493690 RepID=UPI00143C520B|nr:HAD-IA family hydrolase [Paenibacillus sp. HB172176]